MQFKFTRTVSALSLILMSVMVAGCSSGGGSNDGSTPGAPITTIAGTVEAPGGVVATLEKEPGFLGMVMAKVKNGFMAVADAVITGMTPVPNADVELIEIDNNGDTVRVIETTTTDATGAYTFDADLTPSSHFVISVDGAGTSMRALVTSDMVDVNPVSEFVTLTVIAEAARKYDGTNDPLSDFTPLEVELIEELADGFEIDGDGASLDEVLAALQEESGGELENLIEDFGEDGLSQEAVAGLFNATSFGFALIASNEPGIAGVSGSTNTREVEADFFTSSATLGATGDFSLGTITAKDVTLVETSGSFENSKGVAVRTNESVSLDTFLGTDPGESGSMLISPSGSALGNLAGSLLRGAITPDGTVLAVIATAEGDGTRGLVGDHIRNILVALRQGSGMSNNSLSGNFNTVGLEVFMGNDRQANFQTRDIGVATGFIPFSFNGAGTITEGASTGEDMILSEAAPYPTDPPEDSMVVLMTESIAESDVFGLSYDVSSNGSFSISGNGLTGGGAVSPNGEIVVFHDFESEADVEADGVMFLGIKEGSGLSNSILNGNYNFLSYEIFFQTNTLPGVIDSQPSTNFRAVGLFSDIGTMAFNGKGTVTPGTLNSSEVALTENSGVFESTGNAPVPLDPIVGFDTSTVIDDGVPAGTFSVTPTGEVTMTIDGDVFQGYATSDGQLIVLIDAFDDVGGSFQETGRAIAILTKQP